MTGRRNGTPIEMYFFTTIRACEQFIADQGIQPERRRRDCLSQPANCP
jgi:hypothetical protein